MAKKPADRLAAESVIEVVREGLEEKKCRRCGKMAGAVEQVRVAFEGALDPAVVDRAQLVREIAAGMPKQAYDSLGCGGCSGSRVKKALLKRFDLRKEKRSSEPRQVFAEANERASDSLGYRFEAEIQLDPPLIVCRCFTKKRRLKAVVVGPTADAVAEKAVREGLARSPRAAAQLGLVLGRAERALLDRP